MEELIVGTISPLTGAGAAWGWAISGGTEMAAEQINEEGGIELDGTQYRLVVERLDSEYEASGAVDAYDRLVHEMGVQVITGPLGSASALALKDRIEDDQIIAMVNSFTPEMVTEDSHYAFRITPTNFEVAPPMWEWLDENRGDEVNQVALVAPSDETGRTGVEISSDNAAEVGVETVREEFYERGTEDFSAVVTSLLAGNPDVIDTATSPPADTGLIMRQARDQGFDGLFVKTGGAALPDVLAVSGEDVAEGLIMNDNTDTRNPLVEEYIAEFEQRFEPEFNGMFVHFHDGALMGFRALEEAGTLDPDAWVEAMENMAGFEGPLVGEISWGGAETYGADRQMEASMHLYEVQGGEQIHVHELELDVP
jgi:branched-chain amino acid transport system substrate-binding protein